MLRSNKAFRMIPKCLSTSKKGPMEYSYTLPDIVYKFTIPFIMSTYVIAKVSLDLEFEAPKLVKVRAAALPFLFKVCRLKSHLAQNEGHWG